MKFGTWIDGTLLAFLVVSWLPFGSVNSRPVGLTTNPPQQRLPIIFVPGKGGSQIEAEVDRTGLWDDQGLPECEKRLDRYRMWMDLWTLFTREFHFL